MARVVSLPFHKERKEVMEQRDWLNLSLGNVDFLLVSKKCAPQLLPLSWAWKNIILPLFWYVENDKEPKMSHPKCKYTSLAKLSGIFGLFSEHEKKIFWPLGMKLLMPLSLAWNFLASFRSMKKNLIRCLKWGQSVWETLFRSQFWSFFV